MSRHASRSASCCSPVATTARSSMTMSSRRYPASSSARPPPASRAVLRIILVRLAPVPSPTDLADLPFLREALLELVLLAVTGGVLGAWIVLRRLAFFSHAAGSATFPGLVAADASGVSPTLAGVAVALGYAGGVERAGRAGREPSEATALLLVACLAGGVILASDVFESGAAVDRLLFGTLLGLEGIDLALSAAAAALAALATLTLGRAWSALTFDPDSAAALGLPARVADFLLLA